MENLGETLIFIVFVLAWLWLIRKTKHFFFLFPPMNQGDMKGHGVATLGKETV